MNASDISPNQPNLTAVRALLDVIRAWKMRTGYHMNKSIKATKKHTKDLSKLSWCDKVIKLHPPKHA